MPFKFIYYLVFLFLSISEVKSYCWQIGWNPSFNGAPRVTQLAMDEVRVEWDGLVDQRECADGFLVSYWQPHSPDTANATEMVSNTTNFIDIKVSILFLAHQAPAKNVFIISTHGVRPSCDNNKILDTHETSYSLNFLTRKFHFITRIPVGYLTQVRKYFISNVTGEVCNVICRFTFATTFATRTENPIETHQQNIV